MVFLGGYSYYYFSGAKSVVNAASAAKNDFKVFTDSLQKNAPEPSQALQWLRSTATSYAAFIPGAKSYVDSAFDDLDKVQYKHGHEMDEIANKAYKELKEATKSGMSMQTAAKAWEILEKTMNDIAQLAADSAEDILDNHPKLKESVGGNLDKLKGMADSYGPEAKKELDETYQQIKDVIKGGVSLETANKIKKVIEEKTDKVKQLGDQAWKKGLEQTRPYLDKSPEMKKLVEENADALKQGNIGELFEKVKDAASSGNLDSLKEYAEKAKEKAKNTGVGKSLEQYAKMIPGGSEILPRLQKLQEVAKTKSGDAEKVLGAAYKDVQDLLEKRIKELEGLAEDAKRESK